MKENTNTLILASLIPELYADETLKSFQECFKKFGEVVLWSSLPSFGRAIVVYGGPDAEGSAVAVKSALDRTPICALEIAGIGSTDMLRVFYGPPTSDSLLDLLKDNRKDTLEVPNLDRNFLISPPGSPPVWWEQTREEGPNRCTLADDLIAALEGLHVEENKVHTPNPVCSSQPDSATTSPQNSGRASPAFSPSDHNNNQDAFTSPLSDLSPVVTTSSDHLIILPASENTSTPAVLVSRVYQDNESESGQTSEDEDGSGKRPKITLANTPFGIPRSITSVKATAESMQPRRSYSYDSSDHDLNKKITPTSRPPLHEY